MNTEMPETLHPGYRFVFTDGDTILMKGGDVVVSCFYANPGIWAVKEGEGSVAVRLYKDIDEARDYFWACYNSHRGHDD